MPSSSAAWALPAIAARFSKSRADFDVFPLSVLTTSTLARLDEVRPQSRFDQRRFRMNVIVKTERPGMVRGGPWSVDHLDWHTRA